jgi:tyrosyl-tRNA synthetase
MDLHGELEWRGLIYDATDGTRELLARERVSGYIGFDPTASSLHVGSLLVIMTLARLQRTGHSPIALVGGGTGLIGDPKPTIERPLLTYEQVQENVGGIRAQLSRFLEFDGVVNPARLVDNAEWLTTLSAIAFMREVGKHFSVNAMLARDAVKRRIEAADGISYTEFSYALLQAYDFLELYRRFGCTLQMGGSDQWGNITAGMDLVRRVEGAKTYGLVTPLVMTAAGTKFGKTEAGTIWLDPARTSAYEFYQFWLNTDDRDAVRYLKFFTFLEQAPIDEIAAVSAGAPEKRHAQRELAREVTRLVHGATAVTQAEAAAHKLFSGDFASMSAAELEQVLADAPSIDVLEQPDGWRIQTLLVESGLATSISEATRQVQQRAVQVNGRLFNDEKVRLTIDQAIEGKVFVLGKGKKERRLVRVVERRLDGRS